MKRRLKEIAEQTAKAFAEIRIQTNGNKPDIVLLNRISEKYNIPVDKLKNIGKWENYDDYR